MTKNLIDFDPNLHLYRVNGYVLPSVTQILRLSGVASHWNDKNTDYCLSLGRSVHVASAYSDEGSLDEDSVPGDVLPYLEGWRRFLVDSGAKFKHVEKPCVASLGFACTPDRVLEDGSLLEIKTGRLASWHGYQLAGQAIAMETPYARRSVVLLKPGGYSRHEFSDTGDLDKFRSCFTVANIIAKQRGGWEKVITEGRWNQKNNWKEL